MKQKPRLIDEEIRRQIEVLERAFYREKYDEEYPNGRIFDLNNFYMHYPTKEGIDSSYRGYIVENMGLWDKKINPEKWISKLRKNQTFREFYRTVDEAVEESGLTLAQIKEARSKELYWFERKRKTDTDYSIKMSKKWADKMNNLLLRVYLVLRQKGYSRSDLVG